RIATSDNFWAMGDTGPCGPCSEIFYDHGPHIWGGPPGSAEEDGDRFIEIWNLVFMQFEQSADGTRVALPKPSIDTGMGLERVSAVLQGVHNNYDTDLFRALIEASAHATSTDPDGSMAASHRVIADHLRASSFLIADGVMPSNEGRGNVLRRIMRRAMRHAQLLGARDPLMFRLVPALIKQMGVAYPELIRAEALITETLKLEETRFKQTLERGLKLLDDEVEKLGNGQALPGDVAFKLYDTYGFPLDLTQDALRAKNIAVDVDGFNVAMAHQKAEARKAWAGSGEAATDLVWYELKEEVGATEFLGYETEEAEAKLVGLVVDGARVETAAPGTKVALVTNQTPFYGESGGQMGDTGVIRGPGYSIAVTDTQKKLGLHIHLGTVEGGAVTLGDSLHLTVDEGRRNRLRANHSATHLLHRALRDVLGPHVTQKGSLVAEDKLRFDISHPKALSDEEIVAVEAEVNAEIRGNGAAVTRLMTPDEAIKHGALALFGEKYGDEVRVVSMGGNEKDGTFSIELCGGTHVSRTGDIAVFKIVSESAVSAGVRRIEALTGAAALQYMHDEEVLLKKAAAALKASPAELPDRVASLLDERKRLERELAEAKKKLATGGGSGNAMAPVEVGGVKVIAKKLDGVNPKDLRGLVDETKQQLGSGIVAFVAVNDGKAALVVGVTEDLTAKFSAVDLIRLGVAEVGGKGGGGRPDMAQAGGPDGDKADSALDAIVKAIAA
ncbi:MAG: alanine--tRNA ligase, partial [Zavarzinia sp.]|nr:alanine--tRNA ligase [Zavarzinia sp.]